MLGLINASAAFKGNRKLTLNLKQSKAVLVNLLNHGPFLHRRIARPHNFCAFRRKVEDHLKWKGEEECSTIRSSEPRNVLLNKKERKFSIHSLA